MVQNKKILIAEDEEALLTVLAAAFEREGFEVLQVRDGQEGAEIALKARPDLILLDILMPKADGLAMLKNIRKDAWGKNVPVIALTNLSSADTVNEAMKAGVTDFLVKADWHLGELIDRVKSKLRLVGP